MYAGTCLRAMLSMMTSSFSPLSLPRASVSCCLACLASFALAIIGALGFPGRTPSPGESPIVPRVANNGRLEGWSCSSLLRAAGHQPAICSTVGRRTSREAVWVVGSGDETTHTLARSLTHTTIMSRVAGRRSKRGERPLNGPRSQGVQAKACCPREAAGEGGRVRCRDEMAAAGERRGWNRVTMPGCLMDGVKVSC